MPKRETVKLGQFKYRRDMGVWSLWYPQSERWIDVDHVEFAMCLDALLRARKRLARVLDDWVPRHTKRKRSTSYVASPLTVKQAQKLRVCRVCRNADVDGPGLPFLYDYGKEYAHEACLKKEKRHAR